MERNGTTAVAELEINSESARFIEANIGVATSLATGVLLPLLMFLTIVALVGCLGFATYLAYALANGTPGALEMLGFAALFAAPLAIGLSFQIALARRIRR